MGGTLQNARGGATVGPDPLGLTGRFLLLAVVPASVVWVPLARTPAGTIALSDGILMALWAVTAAHLLVHGLSRLDLDASLLALLPALIAVLAAIGTSWTWVGGTGRQELMLFMKKFGLAAVIPAAATQFRAPGLTRAMRVTTVITVAALLAFVLFPQLADGLPQPESYGDSATSERSTGLGTNPNDLAYTAVGIAVLHAALLPQPLRAVDRGLLVAVLAGCAVCVVSSGSRSGLLGAAVALTYFVLASDLGRRSKLALLAGTAAAIAAGILANPVFEERLNRLAERGLAEQNLSTRIEAQGIALRTSARHPLGVGYKSIRRATQWASRGYTFDTTDSVYLDTLLGAGFCGLVALLGLFAKTWAYVARAGGRRRAALRAGLAAFLVFGLATVVPVSVFLAPLFFTIVSGPSHVESC